MATGSTSPRKQLLTLENDLGDLLDAAEGGEQYSPSIRRDEETFEELLDIESRSERQFKDQFERISQRIIDNLPWSEYRRQVEADKTEPMISVAAEILKEERQLVVRVAFDMFEAAELTGARAASNLNNIPADFTSLEEQITRSARQNSNQLVRRINDTTRKKLQADLTASIEMGEPLDDAKDRIQHTLGDGTGTRSQTIARTEPVNAYGEGVQKFGEETGARGKVVDAVIDGRTTPICRELQSKYGTEDTAQTVSKAYVWTAMGGGSRMRPGFHVNCRTGHYLLY